jgi:NAD(P)H-hydrate epimerase
MRAVDRAAIEECGIPSLVLMENAAIGVVEALAARFPGAESAAIFCGPGNNGGDGLAVARHLSVRGWEVRIFLLRSGRELAADAAVQLDICRRLGLPVRDLTAADEIEEALAQAAESALAVDALFGTGLARPLDGLYAELVAGLNELPLPVVAVDLPSGLSGSRAEPLGPHVHADLTVTFAAPKIPHLFPPAAHAVGEMVVVGLGIPERLIEEVEERQGEIHLVTAGDVAELLPRREAESHKGDYGHALVVAGATGKAGAAILCCRAAVRAGAGLVTAGVPEPIVQTVDGGSLESMTLALPALPAGMLAAAAAEPLLAALRGKTVLALGPGLGTDPETAGVVRRLVHDCPLPLVLDADGLNAFAGEATLLAERRAETVLTPHPGELARLLGTTTAEVTADRLAAARRAAHETQAIVVLKGHLTLIASGEVVFVNPTGNPGMATGGSGDVLTGLLAGLLGQGLDALDAAILATYLHGLAGDLAVRRTGEEALAAGDLVDALPAAFAALRRPAGGAESDPSLGDRHE